MIQRVKEQKEIAIDARNEGYKEYIHKAISINHLHKVNELERRMIEDYVILNPTLTYLTRMLDLIPAWYQFEKKKKWWTNTTTIQQSEDPYKKRSKD